MLGICSLNSGELAHLLSLTYMYKLNTQTHSCFKHVHAFADMPVETACRESTLRQIQYIWSVNI